MSQPLYSGREIGFDMGSDYLLYRVDQFKELVDILRIRIDRRFPPDQAVDDALTAVTTESILLANAIKQLCKGD